MLSDKLDQKFGIQALTANSDTSGTAIEKKQRHAEENMLTIVTITKTVHAQRPMAMASEIHIGGVRHRGMRKLRLSYCRSACSDPQNLHFETKKNQKP